MVGLQLNRFFLWVGEGGRKANLGVVFGAGWVLGVCFCLFGRPLKNLKMIHNMNKMNGSLLEDGFYLKFAKVATLYTFSLEALAWLCAASPLTEEPFCMPWDKGIVGMVANEGQIVNLPGARKGRWKCLTATPCGGTSWLNHALLRVTLLRFLVC